MGRKSVWLAWTILACSMTACVSADRVSRADSEKLKLLAVHEAQLQAHRTGDVNLFLDTWHSSAVSVNKGSMETISKTDAYPRFEAYFAETKFVQYEEVKTPIVEVSLDGTLGWVSVEVHAKGERTSQQTGDTQTFEFTSAWVSLFRKIDNEWKLIGNSSSFQE